MNEFVVSFFKYEYKRIFADFMKLDHENGMLLFYNRSGDPFVSNQLAVFYRLSDVRTSKLITKKGDNKNE